MTYLTNLRQRDVDGALEVVAEAAATDGPQPFSVDVVRELLRLIRADQAGYFEYRFPGGGDIFLVEQPPSDYEWDADVLRAALPAWHLADSSWRSTVTRRFSDVLTRTERSRNPWYIDVMRPRGAEHEMKLWLPAPSGAIRGFFFVRGTHNRDFDERDRAVLDLLHPHLGSLRERWGRRRHPPTLTAREAEVIHLVAEGLTNREIARRLVISNATVRTHLENIFEKLGVHTRTAAVTRALSSV